MTHIFDLPDAPESTTREPPLVSLLVWSAVQSNRLVVVPLCHDAEDY